MDRTTKEKGEIRDAACSIIGREITDAEWNESYPQAERKLNLIISREGDADGIRLEPWYLGKIIQEYIMQNAFSKHCIDLCNTKKAALKKDDPTTSTVYHSTLCTVNA